MKTQPQWHRCTPVKQHETEAQHYSMEAQRDDWHRSALNLRRKLEIAEGKLSQVTAQRDELLAALKDLRNAADNCLPCKGDGFLNDSIQRAETAIAKCEANK